MSLVSAGRRLALVAVATTASAASMAGVAEASGAATSCPVAKLSQPFAAWGDGADYELAPGGDVEAGEAGWDLTGGAAVAEGNETYSVTSSTDHRSLRLPGAATATTARTCITSSHPTFRFFAKRVGGSADGRLAVDVVVDGQAGERTLNVGTVAPSTGWAPTAALSTMAHVLAPGDGDTADVSFRFRPIGGGVWSIDDVYVDPFRIG